MKKQNKKEMSKYELLILGMTTGVLATPLAIIANVEWFKTFNDYEQATNGYLTVGMRFMIIFFLYRIFISKKYEIKRIKKEDVWRKQKSNT